MADELHMFDLVAFEAQSSLFSGYGSSVLTVIQVEKYFIYDFKTKNGHVPGLSDTFNYLHR